MRKYPFSKKAVQAMLVASLALSPLASFGVVKAEAADVEYSVAEYSSVDTLISRLNSVYDQLTTTDREALQAARDNLNNLEKFPKESWAVYAEKISKNKDENTAEKADLLKALIDLTTFSTNTETLKRSIDTFKLNQSTNINTVFGSDVTVDMVLNFIAEVESDYVESLRGIDIDTLNETTLVLKFVTSMNNVNEDNTSVNNADNAKVFQRLQHAVNLYQVPAVLAEISGKIDPAPRFVARKAFINALQKVQPVTPPSGGGGGGVTPPVTPPAEPTLPEKATVVVKEQNASGTVEVVTKVSTEKVNEIANLVTAKNSVVPLKLEKPAAGEEVKAQVPAALFTEMGKKNANAVVKVETEEASYKLPASEINVADLAKKLGVSASDVQITVSVNVVKAEDVKDNVDNNNLNPVSNIIEFTVKAVSGDKEESVSKFSVYVEREIVGKTNFKANQSTAVRLNDNGTFSAIPTVFDGKTATIKSLTNSKYTIVENDKTFTDVNNGKNFAESSIEKLASKYIIFGKSANTYAPSEDITRGEFAALISRSLGLVANNPSELKFPDVPVTKAVNQNGEINAAVEAGIIHGYGNGNFEPDEPINRAEAAIMIANAMDFTNVPDSKLDQNKKITSLTDHSSIGPTSRASVERVYQAGIMSGFGSGEFGPDKNTQRDQMARVLDTFLKVSNFMN